MANGINVKDRYLRNPRLKRSGVVMGFTEEQRREWMKCKRNIIYFIENYVQIVNVDKGRIKFELWGFQKKLIKQLVKNRFNIINTARQVGKSTTTIAFLLHFMLFNGDKDIGLLANKGATARKILRKLKIAYEHLPGWLQQGVEEWNKGSILLENGSGITATSTASDAARGESFAILFIDEVSNIKTNVWDSFYTSVYPTISSGKTTKMILVSTPNGLNHFYKLWTYAIEKKNDFIPFSVTWKSVPGRDAAWKRTEIRNTSEEQFLQEQECQFIGSSNTLINHRKIKDLTAITPIFKNLDNNYKVYEKSIVDHTYIMCVDVSHGVLLDYSTISVVDITNYPFTQVAVYRNNNISPLLFPNVISRIGEIYNMAYALIENNDSGGEVVNILNFDLEYENILSPKVSKRKKRFNDRLGLRTTVSTKRLGCSTFKDLIENDKLILKDEDTIHEVAGFVVKGKTFKAEGDGHDDLVMGLVMLSWLSSQNFFKDLTDKNVRKEIFEKRIKAIEEELTPFGHIRNGVDENKEESLFESDVFDSKEELRSFLS